MLDEILVPDAIDHNPFPGEPPGLVGIQQMLRETRAAFPDYREIVAETIAEGDRVAARREVSVTHRGAYPGIPPTGRRGRVTGMAIFRLAGGRVVERWGSSTSSQYAATTRRGPPALYRPRRVGSLAGGAARAAGARRRGGREYPTGKQPPDREDGGPSRVQPRAASGHCPSQTRFALSLAWVLLVYGRHVRSPRPL